MPTENLISSMHSKASVLAHASGRSKHATSGPLSPVHRDATTFCFHILEPLTSRQWWARIVCRSLMLTINGIAVILVT